MSVEIQKSEESNVKQGDSFSLSTFFAPMKSAQSVDSLNIWHDKVNKVSTLLMEEARESSDDPDLYEQLHEASRTLVDEGNKIYDEHVKELPKSADITKNALWSVGGFGLGAWSIITLLTAPVPGVNLVLGLGTLLYAAVKFFGRTQKMVDDQKSEQPLSVKAESGIRFVNASADVSLSVVGLIALTGVFAPYVALPLAIGALAPLIVDAGFHAKEFYDTRKDIKKTQKNSDIQLSKLDGIIAHLKKSGIDHSFLKSVLEHAQKLFWDKSVHHEYKKPFEFSHHEKHESHLNTAAAPLLFDQKLSERELDLDKNSMRL